MSDAEDYEELKKIVENDPEFIKELVKMRNQQHESHVKENIYVPPGLLSKQETMQALSKVYTAIGSIGNPLSRGDRLFYDLKSIIDKALDDIQILKDDVYNDDEFNQ